MKIPILSLVLLLICLLAPAQTVFQYQVAHGGQYHDDAMGIVPTPDGNFLYAGRTNATTANSGYDYYLAKMTPNGTVLWDSTYGGAGEERCLGGIKALPDSTYVMSGYTRSFGAGGADIYLVKVDANGTLVWQRTIGTPGDEAAHFGFIVTSDSAMIVVGYSYGTSPNWNDYYVVKVDFNGNVIWTYSYDSGSYDGAVTVVETPDSGYVIGGLTYAGGVRETYVKLNKAGTQQWVKQYFSYNTPRRTILASDGNILSIGESNQVQLRKLDQSGNTIWYRNYGGPAAEWAYDIHLMPDGGLLLVAETVSFGYGSSDVFLIRTDSSGNELWNTTYGGSSEEWLYSVTKLDNGELIGAGRTKSFGYMNGYMDAYILKVQELEANAIVDGLVYVDRNLNCAYDQGVDDPLPNQMMVANPGPYHTISGPDGRYHFRLPPGQYSLSIDTAHGRQVPSCTSNSIPVIAQLGLNTAADFPTHHLGNHCFLDMDLYASPMEYCQGGGLYLSPCAGHHFRYCFEVGAFVDDFIPNPPTSSATSHITLPPGMSFVSSTSSTPTPSTATMNTISTLGATGQIEWTMSGTLKAGAICTTCFEVEVDPQANIANTSILHDLNVICPNFQSSFSSSYFNGDACSCDPNNMLVTPMGCGPDGAIEKDATLTYRVNFQNVGTGAAHYVLIQDTLDADLDMSSLQIIQSSHTITGMQINPGREMMISFKNMQLMPMQTGYVIFAANMVSGLPDSTVITNQAKIYFDRMPPVQTNQVRNTVWDEPMPSSAFVYTPTCANGLPVYDFAYNGPQAGGLGFNWDFGQMANVPSATNASPGGVTYGTAGPQAVTLTVSQRGCHSSTMRSVNVPQPLTATANASVISCADDSANVMIVATGGTGPYTGNGLQVVAAGTHHFVVTDSIGCTDSVSITLVPYDSMPPNAVCRNVSITLDSSGNGAIVPTDIDDGSSDNCGIQVMSLDMSAFTCADVGTHAVVLTLTDIQGNTSSCSGILTVSGSLPSAIANANINACGFAVSCPGAIDGQASVTATGGCPGYQYLWSNGQTNSTATGLPAGLHSVTVTDASGGTAVTSVMIVEPGPLGVNGQVTATCPGDSTGEIDIAVVGGNGCNGYSYVWNTGALTENVSGLPVGTYTVIVTDAAGCNQNVSFAIGSLPMPAPTFSQNGILLEAAQVWLAYQWLLNGTPIPGATSATDTAFVPGSYSLMVTDSNGCSGISSPLVITGNESGMGGMNISLYPNPTTGVFRLVPAVPVSEPLHVRVFDVFGREIFEKRLRELIEEFRIDLRGVSAGTYFVNVVSESGARSMFKLVVL